jgi:SAM-dependent methyltransferase
VELSEGGARSSTSRIASYRNAHVVRADLARLPFRAGVFDAIYSYGVLHHLEDPEAGTRELARVLAPRGVLAAYLYEDFSERHPGLRALLGVVTLARRVTTRVPHRLLYGLCVVGSPVVFLLCTVPYRLLHRTRLAALVAGMPFRHGTGPMSLAGDLYDRFSAPIERRYSRAGAMTLLGQAGLGALRIAYRRGWVVRGEKS